MSINKDMQNGGFLFRSKCTTDNNVLLKLYENGHHELVYGLIDNDLITNYEYADNNGNTILHCTVSNNDYNMVEHIMNNKLAKQIINMQNSVGDTALHIAVRNGSERMADILVHSGANMTIKNKQGEHVQDTGSSKQHTDESTMFSTDNMFSTNGIFSSFINNFSGQVQDDKYTISCTIDDAEDPLENTETFTQFYNKLVKPSNFNSYIDKDVVMDIKATEQNMVKMPYADMFVVSVTDMDTTDQDQNQKWKQEQNQDKNWEQDHMNTNNDYISTEDIIRMFTNHTAQRGGSIKKSISGSRKLKNTLEKKN